MSNELTAEQILSADDRPLERVDVPEWGGHLYVRTMSGEERDAWEVEQYQLNESAKDEKAGEDSVDTAALLRNLRARLVARTACNARGELLFTPDQAAALGRKSAKALDRVFDVARRLNGISRKDAEELAGN